jgi:DNA-binding transcriptional ArsR family regulator
VADVAVLDDPQAAAVALDPLRSRLLAELGREPASAAGLAARMGLPRQYVRHHLVTLEGQGLVVEVDRRRHGGIVERVLAASAAAYVVSPSALGPAAAEPSKVADRLSAAYLIALAARALREVGSLVRGAERAGKPLPTLSVDADVRFATPEDRAAFAAELGAAVRGLVARYHDESAGNGRWYRVIALSHPRPTELPSEGATP